MITVHKSLTFQYRKTARLCFVTCVFPLFTFSLCLILVLWPPNDDRSPPWSSSISPGYLLNETNCYIQAMNLASLPLRKEGRIDRVPDCSYERQFSHLESNETFLVIEPEFLRYTCSLFSINLDGWSTYVRKLAGSNNISDQEVFYVKCGPYLNFYHRLKLTEGILSKMRYWDSNQSTAGKRESLSVLFIGLNAVSRAQFHRSLPKTIDTLRSMGFVDLQGFHSLAPQSSVNLAAFIMGLKTCQQGCQRAFEDNKCVINANEYLDDCPMIFKDYARKQYVTMYMDNSPHEFSPFQTESPVTDIYVNPIFDVVRQSRNSASRRPHEHRGCLSTESEVQFMLRFTTNFMQTFEHVPFLAFAWFGGPFGEYPYSLPSNDDDFARFFANLQKEIYRRTLIIVTGDHGNKLELYNKGIGGYMERSLPPLFIRLPESLVEWLPQSRLNLEDNSLRLTSAFDVHHTMLHLLNLDCDFDFDDHNNNNEATTHENACFQSVLTDRASLLEKIPTHRDCDTFHVTRSVCACNVLGETVAERSHIGKMVSFSVGAMNAITERSDFSYLCDEWMDGFSAEAQAYYLVKNDLWSTVLVRFFASADGGRMRHHFEIQLNVSREEGKERRMRVVPGTLGRIDAYGNETWCITARNSKEALIKEFCYCLHREEAKST